MIRKCDKFLTGFLILSFCLFFIKCNGQDTINNKPIGYKDSYNLILRNKYIADLVNQKYADSTITNFVKFDESFDINQKQDYYEFWIYQEQPRIQKISKIMIIRVNRFTKLISVYDTEKDLVIPLNDWIKKKK
jgi:uncharacterized Zn-finger protein